MVQRRLSEAICQLNQTHVTCIDRKSVDADVTFSRGWHVSCSPSISPRNKAFCKLPEGRRVVLDSLRAYLLHKNPDRVQSFELSFGKAHVFYPEATPERCTARRCLSGGIETPLLRDGRSHARGRADGQPNKEMRSRSCWLRGAFLFGWGLRRHELLCRFWLRFDRWLWH